MSGFLQAVLKPGSRQFVIVLNAVLAVLFGTMLAVVYTEIDNSIHVFVMLFLVVGLTVSINWFIMEANKLKDVQAAEAQASGQDAKSAPARAKTD